MPRFKVGDTVYHTISKTTYVIKEIHSDGDIVYYRPTKGEESGHTSAVLKLVKSYGNLQDKLQRLRDA